MRRRFPPVLLLLPLLACATEEGTPDFYTGTYTQAEVRLIPGILSPGDTGRAHLIALDESGGELGELAARWSGDNDAVATVDSTGHIIAHTAGGAVTLSTDVVSHPTGAALYISPDTACGDGLDVDDWTVQGSLTWDGTASAGDTAIAAHHAVAWSLLADGPRQVNTGEIIWGLRRPASASEFTFSRRDTLTLGTWKWIDSGDAAFADTVLWWGEVRLGFTTCQLNVDLYPFTRDLVTLVRPGLADSVIDDMLAAGPFTSARVATGAIADGAISVGGKIPLTVPTDADQPFGYGPTGIAARVALIHGDGVDSVMLVQSVRPGYTVPATGRRH